MDEGEINKASAWRMVAITTLIHSASTGLAFGSFGPMMLAIERTYHGTRASTSLAVGLMLLAILAVSAVAARLIERMPLRWVMTVGILLGSVGYVVASVASGMGLLIASYGLMIGPGAALYGPITCHTFVTRWIRGPKQGRAVGLLNMPIVAMLAPLLVQPALAAFGVRHVLLGIAIIQLGMLTLVWSLRERPLDEPGARNRGDAAAPAGEPLPIGRILGGSCFWLVAISNGIAAGAGAMVAVHLIPLAIDQGRTAAQGSLLLAISGGAGILGAIVFGWLCDRIGPSRALALNCVVQGLNWSITLTNLPMPAMTVAVIISGACSAGVVPPFAMMLVRIYGLASFPRAYGLASLASMPFVFGITPLAGLLYVRTGSYLLPFGMMIAGLGGTALLLMVVHALRGRYPTARMATL